MIEEGIEKQKDMIQLGPLKELLKFFELKLDLTPYETYEEILQMRNILKSSKNQEKKFVCVETMILLYFSENDPYSYLNYSYIPQEERGEFITFHQDLSTRIISLLKNETLQDENIHLFEREIGNIFVEFENLYPFFSQVQLLIHFRGNSFSEYLRMILLCIQNQYSLSMKYLMDNGINNTELVFPVVSFKQLFTLKKTLDYFIDVVHQLNNKTKSIDSFSQEICLLTEEFFNNNQIDNLDRCNKIMIITTNIKLLQYYSSQKDDNTFQEESKTESPIILFQKEEILNKIESSSKSKNISSQKNELSPLFLEQGIQTDRITNESDPQNQEESKEKIIIDENSNLRDILKKVIQENETKKKEMRLIKAQYQKILEKKEKKTKENKQLKEIVKNTNDLNEIRLKNLIICQNENTITKRIMDNLKLDSVLLAKRGYIKILIEFCDALNNLNYQFKKKIFGNEIIVDYKFIFDKIKNELNAKAHIPKYVLGFNEEEEKSVSKLLSQLQQYFMLQNKPN